MNKINELSAVFPDTWYIFHYFFPSFFILCLIQLSIMADKGNQKNKEKNRLHFPFHGLHVKWTWCQLL